MSESTFGIMPIEFDHSSKVGYWLTGILLIWSLSALVGSTIGFTRSIRERRKPKSSGSVEGVFASLPKHVHFSANRSVSPSSKEKTGSLDSARIKQRKIEGAYAILRVSKISGQNGFGEYEKTGEAEEVASKASL